MQYTGKFLIKYMVQTRQLRKEHEDSHYCAALFRYLREFCIKYKEFVCFICADDKHKIAIGEGVATSTGVRNRPTMISRNTTLTACDHDFTKLSLTPSVIFFIDIPTNITESFYSGNVTVLYKDTLFQPSKALRHSTEFLTAIKNQYLNKLLPPILCLFTDGGGDHQCTFGSVQVALICLFLQGNFDLLIAVRTAPYQSWTNPAERIMSILNFALQGVALVRDNLSNEMETLFSKVDTIEEIRNQAKKHPQLEEELKNCIKIIQQLLENRTERLVLHDQPFKTYLPATDEEISDFFKVSFYYSLNIL